MLNLYHNINHKKMGLAKQVKGKGSHTLVTFTIDNFETQNPSQVLLLGDFNNWQSSHSSCMMEQKGTSYVKSIKLENGKRYEFRYLSESNGWFNDSSADDYSPSPYEGIENCVVDLSAKPIKKKKINKKDDLKKIEGIGPKIASILTENGIETFKKLSEASVVTLENILKEAGPRYSMHKPNSWPKQATLAFEDKWDSLKELQKQLNRGR